MRKYLVIAVIAGSMILSSCATPGQKTGYGAGIGAAAGAAIGALAYKKDRKKGALIGALAGTLTGGSVGNYLDKQAQELAQVAETRRTENGIVTNLQGDILFATSKSALNPTAKDSIMKISDILKKYPANVISVVGHTDSTGSKSFNQKLSRDRAVVVKNLMVARGVRPVSISAQGVAATQPLATNSTKIGRSKNRRVEIQITVPEQAQ